MTAVVFCSNRQVVFGAKASCWDCCSTGNVVVGFFEQVPGSANLSPMCASTLGVQTSHAVRNCIFLLPLCVMQKASVGISTMIAWFVLERVVGQLLPHQPRATFEERWVAQHAMVRLHRPGVLYHPSTFRKSVQPYTATHLVRSVRCKRTTTSSSTCGELAATVRAGRTRRRVQSR